MGKTKDTRIYMTFAIYQTLILNNKLQYTI